MCVCIYTHVQHIYQEGCSNGAKNSGPGGTLLRVAPPPRRDLQPRRPSAALPAGRRHARTPLGRLVSGPFLLGGPTLEDFLLGGPTLRRLSLRMSGGGTPARGCFATFPLAPQSSMIVIVSMIVTVIINKHIIIIIIIIIIVKQLYYYYY